MHLGTAEVVLNAVLSSSILGFFLRSFVDGGCGHVSISTLLSSGSMIPVLKHGPRSLTCVRVTDSTIQCKMKVSAVTSATASN